MVSTEITRNPTASAGATSISKLLRRDSDALEYLSDPAVAIEAAAFAIPVLGRYLNVEYRI